mgnify:CR=1 FL=1
MRTKHEEQSYYALLRNCATLTSLTENLYNIYKQNKANNDCLLKIRHEIDLNDG